MVARAKYLRTRGRQLGRFVGGMIYGAFYGGGMGVLSGALLGIVVGLTNEFRFAGRPLFEYSWPDLTGFSAVICGVLGATCGATGGGVIAMSGRWLWSLGSAIVTMVAIGIVSGGFNAEGPEGTWHQEKIIWTAGGLLGIVIGCLAAKLAFAESDSSSDQMPRSVPSRLADGGQED